MRFLSLDQDTAEEFPRRGAREIIDAISAARLTVLVFSTGSNESPQVRR